MFFNPEPFNLSLMEKYGDIIVTYREYTNQ